MGADKSTFGEPSNLLMKGGKARAGNRGIKTQLKGIKYLTGDPGTRYSDSYRIKNISEVRKLCTSTTNLPQLAWSMSLRPEDPAKHKKFSSTKQSTAANSKKKKKAAFDNNDLTT